MATAKGPLYSETAQGTIGKTLIFSTANGFQRVQAKKIRYQKIKHRYFDNQTLIQWSSGLIKQYPTQIATIYKPLADAAGLPIQAFMVERLRYCLRNQLTLRLPTNTLGTNVGSGAWLPKVIKTKTRIIVCPPAFPAAGYDGWIITMVQSTTNALNRTQVSGYTTGGTWSTTEWWPFTTFRLSFILLNSQTGTHQTNRLYATITT